MGWMIYNRASSPQTRADERAEIVRIYTQLTEDAPHTADCLQASKVGSVWYLAIQLSPKPGQLADATALSGYVPDAAGRIVYAGVALTSRKHGEWGYKTMCEEMGPNEARAPLSLLARLSPIDPASERHAQDWRDRVRAFHEAKAKVIRPRDGDIIECERPIQFIGGLTARRFKAFIYKPMARARGQLRFLTLDTERRHTVRMSRAALNRYGPHIVAADGASAKL